MIQTNIRYGGGCNYELYRINSLFVAQYTFKSLTLLKFNKVFCALQEWSAKIWKTSYLNFY